MRVISGTARSIPLKTIEGNLTRPTQDRIKETLFNIIGMEIPGKVFLDMFAGSGGIGIEALSRGARKAYFIDNNKDCIEVINANLKKTHLEDKAIVEKGNYLSIIPFINETLDYVFIDPPYNTDMERQALSALNNSRIIDNDTIIIIEASMETDFEFAKETGFTVYREKKYKTNKHVFLRKIDD